MVHANFGHTSRNIEFLACDMIFDVNKHEMADTGEGPHIQDKYVI